MTELRSGNGKDGLRNSDLNLLCRGFTCAHDTGDHECENDGMHDLAEIGRREGGGGGLMWILGTAFMSRGVSEGHYSPRMFLYHGVFIHHVCSTRY